MYFKRGKRAVLALVIALATGAIAYGETLEEILKHVEKKCATMKDMSCTMTMEMRMMGQTVSAKGDMKMVLPMAFLVNLVMEGGGMPAPMKMKMVSDGHTMYQEMNLGDKVFVNKFDIEAAGMAQGGMGGFGMGMGGGMGNLDPAKQLEEVKKFMDLEVMKDEVLEGGQKAWVIEGKFKPEFYQMQAGKGGGNVEAMKNMMGGMRIFIGQQDEYVNRMEFLAGDEEKTRTGEIDLTDLKFNQGLGPELFVYEPPEGVAVNDLTEMMRKQMEARRKAMEAPGEKVEAPAAPAGVLKAGVAGPAFVAKTLDGKTIDLAAMRGKPVVLFFWATWHKGSVKQLSEVNKLAEDRKGAIQVVALSLDEAGEAAAVKKVVEENGIRVSVAIGEKAVLDAYWIAEIPAYVLLDAEGKVAGSEVKPKDLAALEKTVNEITKK